MTKDEILACKDPSKIWAAMQEEPKHKEDKEVWDHITGLTWQKEKERLRKFFDSDAIEAGAHIDYQKKE